MDEEMESRRLNGQPPFDGTTVYLSNFVPLSTLRELLAPVIAILHARFPDAEMLKFDDWHEHDGYVNLSHTSSWNDVQAIVASDDALITEASTGETYVRTAFYSTICEFLLRVYVPDSSDNPYHSHDDPNLVHYGVFDVTCSTVLAKEICSAISQTPALAVESESAQQYSDQRYAG